MPKDRVNAYVSQINKKNREKDSYTPDIDPASIKLFVDPNI